MNEDPLGRGRDTTTMSVTFSEFCTRLRRENFFMPVFFDGLRQKDNAPRTLSLSLSPTRSGRYEVERGPVEAGTTQGLLYFEGMMFCSILFCYGMFLFFLFLVSESG